MRLFIRAKVQDKREFFQDRCGANLAEFDRCYQRSGGSRVGVFIMPRATMHGSTYVPFSIMPLFMT